MYAEITCKLYLQLVVGTTQRTVEEAESTRKVYDVVHGVRLLRLENLGTGITQYYVQDINS